MTPQHIKNLLVLAAFLVPVPARPALAGPITVTHAEVTIGVGLFTPGSVGWTLPVTLQPGESLVLAQNGPSTQYPGTGYSFDGSDYVGVPTVKICFADRPCAAFTDGGYVLSAGGTDPGQFGLSEARDWVTAYVGLDYLVQLGYGDNTRACQVFGCFPTSDGTYVQAAGSIGQPGEGGPATYYDTSMIKVINTSQPSPVPEPASVLLTAGGFLALAMLLRRRPVGGI